MWCYQCGAWRAIEWSPGNPPHAVGPWEKPTGIGGPNPAMKQAAAVGMRAGRVGR